MTHFLLEIRGIDFLHFIDKFGVITIINNL